MAKKRPSVYLTEESKAFLDTLSTSLAGGINQTIDRYSQILKTIELPKFDHAEQSLIKKILEENELRPADTINTLPKLIEAKLTDPKNQSLVDKIEALTFTEKVALIEQLSSQKKGD